MPNTPCLVSESAAAFSLGTHATEADRTIVQVLITLADQQSAMSIYVNQQFINCLLHCRIS